MPTDEELLDKYSPKSKSSDRDLINKYTAQPEENIGMMPFVNKGIAETIGAPIDLLTFGLNLIPGLDIQTPAFGSKAIKENMEFYGSRIPEEGRQAKTIPEHIGQVVGEATSYLIPVGGAVSKLSKGTGLAGSVAKNIWNSMVKHPYITMTSELTAATAAGAGRGVAEKEFPDSPALRTTTEIASGVAGGMVPTALVHTPTSIAIRTGKNVLYKLVLPFTKRGGMYRAGEHIKSLVVNPTATIEEIGKKTIADLPPAVATGEKRLITLYKALIGQDPVRDAAEIERITGSIIKLEKEMRKLGYGSPELLTEITQKRVAALELKMDQRILAATKNAETKLNRLPVARRKANESRVVRQELEKAMHIQRLENDKKWAKVNKDFVVGFENTRVKYQDLYDDLGSAQRSDIPSVLKTNEITTPPRPKKGEAPSLETTLREMQSLRSKLLEKSRIARREGHWNKSRIAEDVADAILVDLDIAAERAFSPDSANLRAAIAATKRFKVRYESGEVGKILGYSKSGAPAINPDLALEMTIGRMGERGAVDISKIVASPEARFATQRYLGRSFVDFATDSKTGKINTLKADRWIKSNEAILDEFPELRTQMSDATTAQQFANQTTMKMQARKQRLADPKISTSARILNRANMGQEIDGIFKSPRPFAEAGQLVRQANKDKTGQALAGLRAGFVEHILEKSYMGSFNELGEQSLSGRSMLNFIKKNELTLRMVFDNNQIARMKRVGTELSKIETFEKMRPGDTELKLKDWASSSLNMIARLTGARVGGKLGSESMGGSLQYASIFSTRAQKFMTWLTRDTAQQLIHDAILAEDPALLQSLLKPIAKPIAKKKDLVFLNRNLNLWLLSTGKRVIDEMEQEQIK
jgi:hypothetical protein